MVDKILNSIAALKEILLNKPPQHQIAYGALAGFFIAFVSVKVSKIIACSLGLAVLFIELATDQGWTTQIPEIPYEQLSQWIIRVASGNNNVAMGFLGGFLIGFSYT